MHSYLRSFCENDTLLLTFTCYTQLDGEAGVCNSSCTHQKLPLPHSLSSCCIVCSLLKNTISSSSLNGAQQILHSGMVSRSLHRSASLNGMLSLLLSRPHPGQAVHLDSYVITVPRGEPSIAKALCACAAPRPTGSAPRLVVPPA